LCPDEYENDGNKRYAYPFEPALVVIMIVFMIVMLVAVFFIVSIVLGGRRSL